MAQEQQPQGAYEPQPMPGEHSENTVRSQPIKTGPSIGLLIGLGAAALLVLAAIVVGIVVLLPKLGGGVSASSVEGPMATLDASNPTLTHPDGISITVLPGQTLTVRLGSVPRQVFLEGTDHNTDLEGALTALPSALDMKSPIYLIDTEDRSGANVEIVIPNESEPFHTLDLYTWNNADERWEFVPGRVEMGSGVIRTTELPANIAVFQTRPVSPLVGTIIEEGMTLDTQLAGTMNLVMPTGLTLQSGETTIGGAPVSGWMPGQGYAVVPVIRSADDNALNAMLNDPALRTRHIEDLRSLVANSGYNGIAIDYREISGNNSAGFTQFLQGLGASFREIDRVVVVVLPTPAFSSGYEEGPYDWVSIGQAADVVVLEGVTNPKDYTTSGLMSQLMQFATERVSRRKLYFATSTYSYDAGAGELIPYDDAITSLGSLRVQTELPEGEESFAPGTTISVGLDDDLNDIRTDEKTGIQVYNVDGRDVWLVTASALRQRLDLFVNYNLGGAVLLDAPSEKNDGALAQTVTEFKVRTTPAALADLTIGWTITDPDGMQNTQQNGLASPFTWLLEKAGDYRVVASMLGARDVEIGSADIKVGDSGAPAPTPTRAPAQQTQAPATQPTTQAAATTPPPAPSGSAGSDGGAFQLGGQVPGFISNGAAMNSAGMTWVKYQIKWSPGMNPSSPAAGYIGEAHGAGKKVLLSITGQLYPSSIDYSAYVEYLRGVAALGPDAIEVWNEMNLDREWPAGQISPTSYVNSMLAPAFNAIKGANPGTMVIIGALAPTGFDNGTNAWSDQRYVQGLASAGAANYANCIGVHHNSGTTGPSVRSGRPEGDHYSWYFLPTMEVYYYGMGGALPVCLTELGYLTPEGFGTPLPSNFSWASGNTLAEHAQWLGEAASLSRQVGYVRLMIVFNVGFTTWTSDDPQAGYSIVRPDGTCPACSTLSAAMQ